MPYRGPDQRRMQIQLHTNMLRHAGQTGIWKRHASAVTANTTRGRGVTHHYNFKPITAFFGQFIMPDITERPTQAGQIIAAEFGMISDFKVSSRDEIVWQGDTYKVEGQPAPAVLDGQWKVKLVRGE